jgi:hypothetical protein
MWENNNSKNNKNEPDLGVICYGLQDFYSCFNLFLWGTHFQNGYFQVLKSVFEVN